MSFPPQHLYSAAVRWKSYSNKKKKNETPLVACFIPGRTRLDGMAINEREVESFTGINIWRFKLATSAQVLL